MLGYGPSSYAIGLYLIFLNSERSESSDLCFGKALLVVCLRALAVRWLPPTDKAVKSKNFLSDPFFLYIFYCKDRGDSSLFIGLTSFVRIGSVRTLIPPWDGLPPSRVSAADGGAGHAHFPSSSSFHYIRAGDRYQKSTQTAYCHFTRSMRPFLSFAKNHRKLSAQTAGYYTW